MACAVGNAVLDIIENENLQQHALELGDYLKGKLLQLQTKHGLIGEVRYSDQQLVSPNCIKLDVETGDENKESDHIFDVLPDSQLTYFFK